MILIFRQYSSYPIIQHNYAQLLCMLPQANNNSKYISVTKVFTLKCLLLQNKKEKSHDANHVMIQEHEVSIKRCRQFMDKTVV